VQDLSRAVWQKSSRSTSQNGNCVEVARLDSAVAMRDSKAPDNGTLMFSRGAWTTFVGATKHGEFDH
jgi:hypothetical protein